MDKDLISKSVLKSALDNEMIVTLDKLISSVKKNDIEHSATFAIQIETIRRVFEIVETIGE